MTNGFHDHAIPVPGEMSSSTVVRFPIPRENISKENKGLYLQGVNTTSVEMSDDGSAQATGKGNPMDDKDFRNLESQIAACDERAQLRLDAAFARIEGQVGRIVEQTTAIRQELTEQRADARALRKEVKEDIAANIEETRSSRRWVIGTVVGTIVAIGIAGVGVDIGLRQFWGSGVQAAIAAHPASTDVPKR